MIPCQNSSDLPAPPGPLGLGSWPSLPPTLSSTTAQLPLILAANTYSGGQLLRKQQCTGEGSEVPFPRVGNW